MDKVLVFDTTLRDGEQSPGFSMSLEGKVKVAKMLEDMGVDIIEAGFPIASKGDFASVLEVSKNIKNSIVAGFGRALEKDIDAIIESTKPAARKRAHIFLATSPLHMKYKLNMSPENVLENIDKAISYARNHMDDVEFCAEDATRSEYDFLCKAIETAINAGAKTINIPDTVGYTTPIEYLKLIEMIKNRVSNIDKAVISVHCHNDLGLAVANSLAGIEGGARQVECTINGIGERAGNAALEEIIMALYVRKDLMPFSSNIDTTKLTDASHTVCEVAGFAVQPNKAIVGANAFAHESGVHQDGMLKHAETYEIMTPVSVGLDKSIMVLGKHSGRKAFKTRLANIGFDLNDNELERAFIEFKSLADEQKIVSDADLTLLIRNVIEGKAKDRLKLISVNVTVEGEDTHDAKVVVEFDGEIKILSGEGNGPVDPCFAALRQIVPDNTASLRNYDVKSIEKGSDARVEVSLDLYDADKEFEGKGLDEDIVIASCKAYVEALNKVIADRNL